MIGSFFLDSIKYFGVHICVMDNFAKILFFCQYSNFNKFFKEEKERVPGLLESTKLLY